MGQEFTPVGIAFHRNHRPVIGAMTPVAYHQTPERLTLAKTAAPHSEEAHENAISSHRAVTLHHRGRKCRYMVHMHSSSDNIQLDSELEFDEHVNTHHNESDLRTIHPPKPVIEYSARKVRLWLSHLESVDESRPSLDKPNVNERSVSSGESEKQYYKAGNAPKPYWSKRHVKLRQEAKNTQRVASECSLSGSKYSEDDYTYGDGRPLRKRPAMTDQSSEVSDRRNDAVSSTGFLADRSATTDTKSSLPTANAPSSESNFISATCEGNQGNVSEPFCINNKMQTSNRGISLECDRFKVQNNYQDFSLSASNNGMIDTPYYQLPATLDEPKGVTHQKVMCGKHQKNARKSLSRQRAVSSVTINSDTTAFMQQPLTRHQPITQRINRRSVRRRLMVIQGLKVVGKRLRHAKGSRNPLRTLAFL